ncbi:MFS transporter [Proteobacteria bacterium 005FR1]|nr:MFS transporter [Proteobacteria bacterium 005FR1]
MLVFGFAAVFWGNFGQSFFIGAFSEAIQSSLKLSASEYGNAYSLATVASAVTVAWLGGLIDHFRLKNYALMVSIGLLVAMLIMSQVQHLLTLILAFSLLRLFGQALLPHTGVTTMARAFQANRGMAVSIATSGVPAGEVVLPALAATLIAWLGWQAAFLSLSLTVPLVLIPLLLYCVRHGFTSTELGEDMHAAPGKPQSSGRARKALLSDYRFWLVLPGYMAGPFIVTGIFVHQNYVAASKDWTLTWFATSFVVYGIVHWISSLVAGALVDRFHATRLLPFFPLPMTAALFVLAFVPGDWVAIPVMALLAVSIGSSPPISNSLWPEIYGSRNIGAIRSITVAIMVFATALSPTLFGWLIDAGVSLAALMGSCAVYVLGSVVLMVLSYPLNPSRIDPEHDR